MKALNLLSFVGIILLSITLSCERIPPPERGFELGEIIMGNQQSIPLDYGNLVSVTSPMPGMAHLWFEDEKHTIRQVQVNYGKNIVHREVFVITRH